MPPKFSKHVSVVVLFMTTALACSRKPDVERNASQLHSQTAPAKVHPYPPGRWRLADSAALTNVVLWVSHVLIRHRDAKNLQPAFAIADWYSRSPGGQRSRVEALALAEQLRERAAARSEPFAALASAHSEDIATQPLGGSLGGVQAFQLALWPEVLDTLAALRPGEISQVVETQYGFHIFELRPPPPEQTVSGAHIVVAHNDAGWIKVLGKGQIPARSRADALTLANELYERARQQPAAFSQLVEQYSEHGDAARGGDMGTWSTREPSISAREVEVLAKLAIGEVAPPLDSPVGFQIIQRTPNRERELLALDSIRLSFDALRTPPDPSSKEMTHVRATELAQLSSKDPSRFSELKKGHCCDYIEQWADGRGLPALTTALLALRVGEIAPEPIESLGTWVIAKRVAPSAEAAAISYELPSPPVPDVAAFFRSQDQTVVRNELQKLADEVSAALSLPEEAAAQVRRLHRDVDRFPQPDTLESRTAAFQSLLSDVESALDAGTYAAYLKLMHAHFEGLLLKGG